MNKEFYHVIQNIYNISDSPSEINAIYYFIIMHYYKPYISKINCGFVWENNTLVSKQMNQINLPNNCRLPKKFMPNVYLFIEHLKKQAQKYNITLELLMLCHFVLHYHFKTKSINNIEFVLSQLPGNKKPEIKNCITILNKFGLNDLNKKENNFSLINNDWNLILVK